MFFYKLRFCGSNTESAVSSEAKFNIGNKVIISKDGNEFLAEIIGNGKPSNNNNEKIRIATDSDLKNYEKMQIKASNMLPDIKDIIKGFSKSVKISFIIFSLNGKKMIISYTSDERLDYRDIVKKLANKYSMRIEMKQIGNRDEVAMIGAIGSCGRECCCKSFLKEFDKVSIKMAKNQNIALNPAKINGMCGRLLCCLKYEDDLYKEQLKKMPKINSIVETPDGEGKVIYNDILGEKVTLYINKSKKEYPLSDIIKKD